ncbi:hypothetical protein HMPREF9554_00811 [Treponema phagedenis F0421]|nr:hypothetical protein HMPREF9554_00811 [Treponema phagedenis F0421]
MGKEPIIRIGKIGITLRKKKQFYALHRRKSLRLYKHRHTNASL